MPAINTQQLNDLIGEIKGGKLTGKIYHDKYPPATAQSGPTCGMYSLKWAIDYRALKTGIKGALCIPARARDVCANCGTDLRDLTNDVFKQNVVAIREPNEPKKVYYCDVCALLPGRKRIFVSTMRSLAKAQGLSVMGELMEPPKLLKLAELSGFQQQASLVDVSKSNKNYEQCLKDTLDAGKLALLIYDIDPSNGGPGTNGGTKAHWCTIFGYYDKDDGATSVKKTHVLVVHGWSKFYDWDIADLLASVDQMKVHPGWDLRLEANKTALPTQKFASGEKPHDNPAFKKDGIVKIPQVAPTQKQVTVPGTDYSNWNKQFIAFG